MLSVGKLEDAEDKASKGRSIFYTFVLRCVSNIINHNDDSETYSSEKLLRFLKTTQADVYQQMQHECKLESKNKEMVNIFMKSKAI